MIERLSALVLACLLPLTGVTAPLGDCTGTPDDAVLELPAPLSDWGTLACTPYGHIIANRPEWVWHYSSSRKPVMVPSQMAAADEVGNVSYFTRIDFAPVPLSDPMIEAAWVARFESSPMNEVWTAYRLTAVNAIEQGLTLFFFEHPGQDRRWGIFCNADGTGCRPETAFHVLRRDSVEWRRSTGT